MVSSTIILGKQVIFYIFIDDNALCAQLGQVLAGTIQHTFDCIPTLLKGRFVTYHSSMSGNIHVREMNIFEAVST